MDIPAETLKRPRVPTVIIEPPRRWAPLRLKDLWAYRELFLSLAWRDLKVRYKQTELGAAWAVIQPFMMMVVFSIFFSRVGKLPSSGVPYAVSTYAALLPWTYFANSITQSGNSLISDANLITKVYFPRLIIPMASVIAYLVDLGIAFILLVAIMLFYSVAPTVALLALPLFVVLATGAALGTGLWLSALNVEYRDIRYVIPFVTQFWLFLSPVAYPSTLVPAKWRALYALNPMVGVIEGFRWAIIGKIPFPGTELLVSGIVVVVLVVSGLFYFRRMEKTFADVV